MKVSNIFLIIFIIALGISSFQLIQNDSKAKSLIERLKNGQRPIEEYKKYTNVVNRGTYIFNEMVNHEAVIKIYQERKRKEILTTGGVISTIFFVLFIIVLLYENKTNPKKNLDSLRKNNIISESEYKDKIEETERLKIANKDIKRRKKEYEKLLTELNNLKAKGILSEDEYNEKLLKISELTA